MRKIAALLATMGIAAFVTWGIYQAGFTAGRSASTYVIDRPLDELCTLPDGDATKAMEDCFKKSIGRQDNSAGGQCVEGLPCFKGIWKPDIGGKDSTISLRDKRGVTMLLRGLEKLCFGEGACMQTGSEHITISCENLVLTLKTSPDVESAECLK